MLFSKNLFENLNTSVCLIYYVASTADSKKCLGDMRILNMVSKSFTCPPIILKIFRSEISTMVEISTNFDLLSIVEFQMYSFILPILQANLGKNLAKMLSNCVICIKSEMWDIRDCGYARVSLGTFGEKVLYRAWIR